MRLRYRQPLAVMFAGSQYTLNRRTETGDEGRFQKFTREWIADRADSLDISWLKDDNNELPEPSVLARDAMAELEGAIDDLRGILAELGEGDEQERV